jgi:hypothetical protein
MKGTYPWLHAKKDIFWGEIAPCDHVCQIYENNDAFLDLLTGFVSGGFSAGESVAVIASHEHLNFLHQRLQKEGINLFALELKDQYIPLSAEDTLSEFMINGWPDESLFHFTVSTLLDRAQKRGRRVRVFGEMVAILWAQGNHGATVRLEHLWNKFCETQAFSLFCAYPKSGFTENAEESLTQICCSHAKMIAPSDSDIENIVYQDLNKAG